MKKRKMLKGRLTRMPSGDRDRPTSMENRREKEVRKPRVREKGERGILKITRHRLKGILNTKCAI